MIILGMAHAVAFTCTEHEHTHTHTSTAAARARSDARRHYPESYRVGVLQAAVLSLIQDVEASALVICAVGCTGDLK